MRESTGSYDIAWWVAGALCLLAAIASYAVPRGDQLRDRERDPDPDPQLAPA